MYFEAFRYWHCQRSLSKDYFSTTRGLSPELQCAAATRPTEKKAVQYIILIYNVWPRETRVVAKRQDLQTLFHFFFL